MFVVQSKKSTRAECLGCDGQTNRPSLLTMLESHGLCHMCVARYEVVHKNPKSLWTEVLHAVYDSVAKLVFLPICIEVLSKINCTPRMYKTASHFHKVVMENLIFLL